MECLTSFYHNKPNPNQLANPSGIQGHGRTWTNSKEKGEKKEDLENIEILSQLCIALQQATPKSVACNIY